MGNHNGRDSHGPTGSPLEFFHTAPTTPSEAALAAMALSSADSSNKAQAASAPSSTTPSSSTTTTTTTTTTATSPIAEWTHKLSAASEWAVISVDSITSSETNVSDAARQGKAAGSPGSPASLPPTRSPSQQSWQERDSGLESQAAAESTEEEVTMVLLSLMEHYRASLGPTASTDVPTAPVVPFQHGASISNGGCLFRPSELLKHLLTERDELVEEVDTLRETLKTERLEWQQFQSDLQVAVSVADRLRVESEQALCALQENHRAMEEQLVQALSTQQEMEKELESVRAEHRDVCRKLSELTLQQQQERAELDNLRYACRVEDITDFDKHAERQDSEQRQGEDMQEVVEDVEAQTESETVEMQQEDSEAKQELETKCEDQDLESEDGSGSVNLTGKGVAEGYLRSLAALEKKKEGRGHRDPRRIVMLSERSWSLSRLPLPADSSNQNGIPKNTSTTLPLVKKEPTNRRVDRFLQRQDSWSSFYTVKQDEDQISDSIKPQDGFSALLRRHGGSRRNSLLRWCQSRTQGYKNIEITNFSSSWEDGLAFCAVYHTYLPNRIPFDSLNPAEKKENLDLAFKTGESVGITATLTVDEMLKADGPDWQRVLSYVESLFRHFEM